MSRSGLTWCGAVALLVIAAIGAAVWQPAMPRYQGKRLSYWLAHLKPTIITPTQSMESWPQQRFRNLKAATDWSYQARTMDERASRVVANAGPECLPLLFSELTIPESSLRIGVHRRIAFLRRWAYDRGWTDAAPLPSADESEVRRGQALTAILLLNGKARPLVPKLAAIASRNRNDAVTRTASYAFWQLDPDEFRRVRSPAVPPQTNLPASAAAGAGGR